MYKHRFRKRRSCLTLENWTEAFDEGHCVDAIFLEFQEAFGTVSHWRLIMKLKAYGVWGELADWIADFLQGRKMSDSL